MDASSLPMGRRRPSSPNLLLCDPIRVRRLLPRGGSTTATLAGRGPPTKTFTPFFNLRRWSATSVSLRGDVGLLRRSVSSTWGERAGQQGEVTGDDRFVLSFVLSFPQKSCRLSLLKPRRAISGFLTVVDFREIF